MKTALLKFSIGMLVFFLFAGISLIQDTVIKLPASDTSSSFKVINSSDETLLNVRADGNIGIRKDNPATALDVDGTVTALQFKGDGSQLTNVKPLVQYAGGNQLCQITKNYAWYQNVKSVSITVPASGKVIATVSGYARWESKGWDLLLGSILRNSDPNESWDAENEFFRYLIIATDYNCTDSSDQYASFTSHRGFNVGAGTHTFTFWANKYTSTAKVRVDDVNISAMYFPTGSVSVANPIANPTYPEPTRRKTDIGGIDVSDGKKP